MAQNIIYSPWENITGPWLCLMTALLLFSLLGLFSFVSVCLTSLIKLIKPVKFFTGKSQAEDTVGGSGGIGWARTIWTSVLLSESESESCSVMSDPLQPLDLYSPWNSPGQNTEVGNPSLLQGIFPTQESNPGLQHCGWILYQLSHKWTPRILEWVAYPFSSRSPWPRNLTWVSCIAGGFFTNWATREAQKKSSNGKERGNIISAKIVIVLYVENSKDSATVKKKKTVELITNSAKLQHSQSTFQNQLFKKQLTTSILKKKLLKSKLLKLFHLN